ncbi:MAG: hypothetical protein KAU58_00540 [Candidatus Omnitrophica bacterium]|nr:hypothetical protein [Candidatus Omnitrophota bacterium]
MGIPNLITIPKEYEVIKLEQRKASIQPIKSKLKISILDDQEISQINQNTRAVYIISLQYDRIMKKKVIDICDVLNLHFSLLPKCRGVSPIAHAMINCEEKTGVSLHYIDEGTDTGDLIAQAETKIEDTDTGRSIYEKLTKIGIALFKDNYKGMLDFNLMRRKQNNKNASYYAREDINFNENTIRWNKTTRQVSYWIRAFIFPPFQYPKIILDKEYNVTQIEAEYFNNKYEPCGTICDVNEEGIKVATTDGYVVIKRLEANGVKVPIESLSKNIGRVLK